MFALYVNSSIMGGSVFIILTTLGMLCTKRTEKLSAMYVHVPHAVWHLSTDWKGWCSLVVIPGITTCNLLT